jgi:hypothetical protein
LKGRLLFEQGMARQREPVPNIDIQEGEITGILKTPHLQYIMTDEYNRIKRIENRYHKMNGQRGISILNRMSLATSTFVLGDMLRSGPTNLHIVLLCLLIPTLVVGHIFELR